MRRRVLAATALVALVFGTGPTVGDVGGCGQSATALNESRFVSARKKVDCQRCQECGIETARCASACDPKQPSDVGFPAGCAPLLHDGEVCLDALLAASCGDYASYVSDQFREVPTECQFCLGDGGEIVPAAGDGGP